MSDEVKNQILEINKKDAAIYDYFEKVFWNKVKEYGPTFDEDVKELRLRLKKLEKECKANGREGNEKKWGFARFSTYEAFANDNQYCQEFFIIDDFNSRQSHKDLKRKIVMFEKELKDHSSRIITK